MLIYNVLTMSNILSKGRRKWQEMLQLTQYCLLFCKAAAIKLHACTARGGNFHTKFYNWTTSICSRVVRGLNFQISKNVYLKGYRSVAAARSKTVSWSSSWWIVAALSRKSVIGGTRVTVLFTNMQLNNYLGWQHARICLVSYIGYVPRISCRALFPPSFL